MLLREGSTCWKLPLAERVAFLVDADEYFDRLVSAFEQARQSIRICGWDVHSRVTLRRGPNIDKEEWRLGTLLNRLVEERTDLKIHLLMWDFSVLYAGDREVLQRYRLGWKSHAKIHFEFDDNHPLGACHHQKFVVIDDRLAFVGGVDLTQARWDTPEHLPANPHRTTPSGEDYLPYHDVQAAVAGPVASALGDLFRQRWYRATGDRLESVDTEANIWPVDLEVDLTGVGVGICRTEPKHDGRPEVREIEQLYTQAIASANHHLILENQYATSKSVLEALEAKLRLPRGPEILLILPRETSGWLETVTMGKLRQRFLQRLLRADTHGRLLVCYPHRSGLEEQWIKVHSKVCFVDDWFVTVGSANLSNRSMGLDTECNLALEAGNPDQQRALVDFRHRLLGEHLGCRQEDVRKVFDASGSLLETVRRIGSDERHLEPVEVPEPESDWIDEIVPDDELLDPERPLEPRDVLENMRDAEEQTELPGSTVSWWRIGALAAVVLALTVAWHHGPLADWVTGDRLRTWIEMYRNSSLAGLLTIGLFVLGGLLFFPVTLLILQTTTIFGPLEGALYSLAGSLVSAASLFILGRWLGASSLSHLAGKRLQRVKQFLARRGTLSITLIRLTPVAPFSLVNFSAGAVGVGWLPFLLGTFFGMIPGVVALALLASRLIDAIRDPGGETLAALAVTLIVVLGIAKLGAILTARFSQTTAQR